jgi:hypothetical protein
VVEFYLKLKLILRIISYLTYICWEIDNFVIKSDFSVARIFLQWFCQQGEGFCMHVFSSILALLFFLPVLSLTGSWHVENYKTSLHNILVLNLVVAE